MDNFSVTALSSGLSAAPFVSGRLLDRRKTLLQINSKCNAIALIVPELTDCKITQAFGGEPKPDLYTVFAFCNAIRKDSDAEKYTLAQFNCHYLRYISSCTYLAALTNHREPILADFQDLRLMPSWTKR